MPADIEVCSFPYDKQYFLQVPIDVHFHMSRYGITVYIETFVLGCMSRKPIGFDNYVNSLDLYVIVIE